MSVTWLQSNGIVLALRPKHHHISPVAHAEALLALCKEANRALGFHDMQCFPCTAGLIRSLQSHPLAPWASLCRCRAFPCPEFKETEIQAISFLWFRIIMWP